MNTIKKITFLVLASITLFSCSNGDDKSDAYGNFEATETTISSEANGKLLMFNIEEGQQLKQGQKIGLIDTTDLSLKKEQLTAQREAVSTKVASVLSQIEVYNQQKKNLLIDKLRIEKMLKDEAATQKQLDDINGAIDVIEKNISAIKTQNSGILNELEAFDKQIEQVSLAISKCYLKNPINGTVLVKLAEKDEIVNMGKPLYQIADLTNMELRVYVSGTQLANIKLGQKADVLIDKTETENRKLEGKISWISSSAEFTPKVIQTKKERVNMVYAVKVVVKNDGTLKIGMPGDVLFK
ncbi:MAG: HlyD family efflux transporter periplasmic adaptor subunit [Saprospiraceae bacterium]|nr:HlyD family efflux transporter periplasmic adaptor subunit [Saprospiraceae bacterium]